MKYKRLLTVILALAICLSAGGCAKDEKENKEEHPGDVKPAALPAPETDETTQFGVDKNINQETIDEWLFRDDVAYRDVRMLFDPAEYSAIGGEADLTATIEGFKVVPYPYIASLQSLPVANAYTGDRLFDVEWTEDGHVVSATPLYEESMMVLEELFPKDKAVFLMCGGGGYANMTKQLLLFLGWDEGLLYNTGANWTYRGDHAHELVVYPEERDGNYIYATWRADYAYISFDKLNPYRGEKITQPVNAGNSGNGKNNSGSSEKDPGKEKEPANTGSAYDTFSYTHYASGGTAEEYQAVILFEQSNSTFTAYQVAYSSCTCRNAIVNYYMVCYVEILNTKKSPDKASIRDITCLDNKGVWGDSNPNYYIAEYTEDYMNEHLTKGFIGASKADLDSFKGYGTWIENLDADALSGATVSSSNMQSMLKALFEYHAAKYY